MVYRDQSEAGRAEARKGTTCDAQFSPTHSCKWMVGLEAVLAAQVCQVLVKRKASIALYRVAGCGPRAKYMRTMGPDVGGDLQFDSTTIIFVN